MRIEAAFSAAWNAEVARGERRRATRDLTIGDALDDGSATGTRVLLRHARRAEHLSIFGRTGVGKSSLLKHLCSQDIAAGRGFVFFDLHGDAVPELLAEISAQEMATEEDFSARTVVLNPADPQRATGLQLLGASEPLRRFIEVAEMVEILKRRWNLEALGGRTEELLRNTLLVLADADLTFIDLPLILTSRVARRVALRRSVSQGVREYFETRFDPLSDGLQSVFREAVLNKATAFTADPYFRAVLGQRAPAFRLSDAVERGYFVFVMLPRGTLGVESQTFGSLILARLKHALFGRTSRELFTIYADEFQSLSGFDVGIDELLSESRKFGVSVVAASQFLEQHSPLLQHALLSVGAQAFFQLSAPDAARVADLLGGAARMSETLRTLPRGELLFRSGTADLVQTRVPTPSPFAASRPELLERIAARWTRRRDDVEDEMRLRAGSLSGAGKDDLEAWR